MLSNIVVGTDGSETAKAVVAVAIELARTSGATLHLVHAYRPSSDATAIGHLGDPVVPLEARVVLTEAAAGADGIPVETHAAGAAPADAVVRIATQIGADLIVVGSKGMRGARRVIGSVPNSIAHSAPCSVLIAKTA
jgi:nucleotide-binding universal stress UspA family protein